MMRLIRLQGGSVVSVEDASPEQFDAYIIDILARVYPAWRLTRIMHEMFEGEDGTIDRATWEPFARFYVMNRIAGLAEVRRAGIALFVDATRRG